MTVQQAIEKHIEECRHRIDNIQSFMESNPDADIAECADNMESLRMAAVALEVIRDLQNCNMTIGAMKEYMKFENECVQKGFTLQSVLEAREKQIAKKPNLWGDGYADGVLVYDMYDCPNCDKHYEVDYEKYDYCPNCGQKLDWQQKEAEY